MGGRPKRYWCCFSWKIMHHQVLWQLNWFTVFYRNQSYQRTSVMSCRGVSTPLVLFLVTKMPRFSRRRKPAKQQNEALRVKKRRTKHEIAAGRRLRLRLTSCAFLEGTFFKSLILFFWSWQQQKAMWKTSWKSVTKSLEAKSSAVALDSKNDMGLNLRSLSCVWGIREESLQA